MSLVLKKLLVMELMMSKITVNAQEINIKNIIDLLDKLMILYQNTQEDRKKIKSEFLVSDEQASLLEEIELLTINLRGYASQVKAKGFIENSEQAVEYLQRLKIFNIPIIAQFYFTVNDQYKLMKNYIIMLDYLRLLLLEFLN